MLCLAAGPLEKFSYSSVWTENGNDALTSVTPSSLSIFAYRLERAMGIELHPKFLSLTEARCYQPLIDRSSPHAFQPSIRLKGCQPPWAARNSR